MARRKTMDVSEFTSEEEAGKKLITPGTVAAKPKAKKARPIDVLGPAKKQHKIAMTIYLQEDELEAVEQASARLKRPKTEIVRASIRIAMGMTTEDED